MRSMVKDLTALCQVMILGKIYLMIFIRFEKMIAERGV
jgi:hypothetical protein